MIESGAILGVLNKAAPSLIGVAKRNYEVSKLTSLVRLGTDENFELINRLKRPLEEIASLQSAVGISDDDFERILASAEFGTIARRLLALQWTVATVRTPQEQFDWTQRRAAQNPSAIRQDEPAQLRAVASGQAKAESPVLTALDQTRELADDAERKIGENSRLLIRAALENLLMEKANAPNTAQVAQLASSLMEASVVCSAYLWASAQHLGLYAQDRAVMSANTRLLFDEVMALRVATTIKVPPEVYAKYESFALTYLDRVRAAHRNMIHPDFNDLPPILFDDLYVSPFFVEAKPSRPQQGSIEELKKLRNLSGSASATAPPKRISSDEVLRTSYRTVVIGRPGAGKSTLARKVCNDVQAGGVAHLFGGRTLIPLLIVLRDYAIERKKSHCSIIKFAELRTDADFQTAPPLGFFERLLVAGRVLVIFDGLDELLDVPDRIEVRNAVQHFADLYPSTPILVTSREVGYDQAPLDLNKFMVYRLQPFDPDQVEQYSVKWFRSTPAEFENQRVEMAAKFLREAETVPDLCANPLTLALLCNLYYRAHYLPDNRHEVYEQCAKLLFDIWDRWRHIVSEVRLREHIWPIMGYLAYWIYSDLDLQKGVTESQLVEKTELYLRNFIRSRPKALDVAKEIVGFFNGRAWLFTDTGATEFERLYQFTHQTFLEYFTADHIVAQAESADELVSFLIHRIMCKEWILVTELAFQIKAKRHHALGADLVLRSLMKQADVRRDAAIGNLGIFCLRLLKLLHPTLEVQHAVFAKVANIMVASFVRRDVAEPSYNGSGELKALLDELLSLPLEHEALGAAAFIAALNDDSQSVDATRGATALEVTLGALYHIEQNVDTGERDSANYLRDGLGQIVESCADRMEELGSRSLQLSFSLWWRRRLSLESIVRYHGVSSLFIPQALGFERPGPSLVEYLLPHFTGEITPTDETLRAREGLRNTLSFWPEQWDSAAQGDKVVASEKVLRLFHMPIPFTRQDGRQLVEMFKGVVAGHRTEVGGK